VPSLSKPDAGLATTSKCCGTSALGVILQGEIGLKSKQARGKGSEEMSEQYEWCGVPVIVDDTTNDLFEMPEPDEDPEQKPAFHVTESTAELVPQDFELYKHSLERMAADWREEKEWFMQENASNQKQPRAA
jgi:hypothetical protein